TLLVEQGLYGPLQVKLQTAITKAMAFAQARGYTDVVFQDSLGIPGSPNLSDEAAIKALLTQYSTTALFAAAAGNGNFDINNSGFFLSSTTEGGWPLAPLSNYNSNNVIAVGALQHIGITSPSLPLENAVIVNRASYSNYSSSPDQIFLMAPTDSPAIFIN